MNGISIFNIALQDEGYSEAGDVAPGTVAAQTLAEEINEISSALVWWERREKEAAESYLGAQKDGESTMERLEALRDAVHRAAWKIDDLKADLITAVGKLRAERLQVAA